MEEADDKKRRRDNSEEAELEIFSPEVKRLRENLLDDLDDETDFGSTSRELDSFMKSFEEEINASPPAVDLPVNSGDSRRDLGYLFEASDDELGIPPAASSSGEATTESARVESDSSELGSECREAPGYDSFEFGMGGSLSDCSGGGGGGGGGEYAALDGLFDNSGMGFGLGDFVRRHETLPAK